ncbi:MAG: 1-acyl-sn-glycerol-3-phosphate acyltransferase, partial [Deltaproteobacteria bacterium]|nr:1-acyl-sn-glycerol-3-phosphate acyltransferase [Nannocystaceae bacterium]
MPRALKIIVVGLMYLAFGGFGAFLCWVVIPLGLIGVHGREPRIARAQDIMHRWTRRYFATLRWVGVAKPEYPRAPDVLTHAGGAVVIANHPSLLDIVFIMAALPRITYVAKESWLASPLMGWMLRTAGHIGAPRGKTPADGAIAMERMMEALRAGRALLVFPEGTRSPERGLWSFQRGAFEAAMRTGVPIVPCVLDVDPPMLRKNQPWYDVAPR